MTKVEELREKWFDALKYEFSGMLQGMSDDLDAVLAASHAEGVAEERERIRKAAQPTECDINGYAILFAVPASVLAPTKEKP